MNIVRVGTAIGLAVFMLVSLWCLVSAQDVTINVQGQASKGIKVAVNFPSYNLETRAVDSQVTFGSSIFYSQGEEGNAVSASTDYNMQGWWNQLSEKVGVSEATSNAYKGLASGVDFTGKAIVGQGSASISADLFEHQQQAQGVGLAVAGMALLNVASDEAGGNITISQGQARYVYEGTWRLEYEVNVSTPMGASEDGIGWWGSICQGLTGWEMPKNNWSLP